MISLSERDLVLTLLENKLNSSIDLINNASPSEFTHAYYRVHNELFEELAQAAWFLELPLVKKSYVTLYCQMKFPSIILDLFFDGNIDERKSKDYLLKKLADLDKRSDECTKIHIKNLLEEIYNLPEDLAPFELCRKVNLLCIDGRDVYEKYTKEE